ncbi:hypothetical protein C9374_008764 [Naegleria lovaniensis]|uniref:Uncharacterized protein n=1 Tax=Naegleria lovaniensis TaxID=51637 RepID=A0AA88GEU0_NAELO|nr:uncharacterized protein C9374_008764 [Naegleria lovaniensis]KAG2378142.1 hypothetical protein C9374_008764 [Naegleria lovaniensis]
MSPPSIPELWRGSILSKVYEDIRARLKIYFPYALYANKLCYKCPICEVSTTKKDKQKRIMDHFLTAHLSVNEQCKEFSSMVFDIIQCCNEENEKHRHVRFKQLCERMKESKTVTVTPTQQLQMDQLGYMSSDDNFLAVNVSTQSQHSSIGTPNLNLPTHASDSAHFLQNGVLHEQFSTFVQYNDISITDINNRLAVIEHYLNCTLPFQLQEEIQRLINATLDVRAGQVHNTTSQQEEEQPVMKEGLDDEFSSSNGMEFNLE